MDIFHIYFCNTLENFSWNRSDHKLKLKIRYQKLDEVLKFTNSIINLSSLTLPLNFCNPIWNTIWKFKKINIKWWKYYFRSDFITSIIAGSRRQSSRYSISLPWALFFRRPSIFKMRTGTLFLLFKGPTFVQAGSH